MKARIVFMIVMTLLAAYGLAVARAQGTKLPFDVYRFNGLCVITAPADSDRPTAIATAPLELCQAVGNNGH